MFAMRPGSRFAIDVRVLSLCSIFALFWVPRSFAEVTRVDITSRTDVAFAGYERIAGRVFFVVDPADPRNAVIADIDTAPKNAQGRVEFSADFSVLRPKSDENGVAILDVPNRGGARAVPMFNRARVAASAAGYRDGGRVSGGRSREASADMPPPFEAAFATKDDVTNHDGWGDPPAA